MRQSKAATHEKSKEWKQSEALVHDHQPQMLESGKPMTGFGARMSEESADKTYHEMANLENSYGNIVMGANKEKDFVFLVREKRRHNAPELMKDQKEIKKDSRKELPQGRSSFVTNSHDDAKSAVAFRTTSYLPPDKLMGAIQKFEDRKKQENLGKMLPFLKDGKQEEQADQVKEQSSELQAKQQLQHQVEQKLRLALKKSLGLVGEYDDPFWYQNSLETEELQENSNQGEESSQEEGGSLEEGASQGEDPIQEEGASQEEGGSPEEVTSQEEGGSPEEVTS
ncbi:hypothetical protein LQZ18_03820 [Lachnospiraceae bacterium ZAX-1]